MKWFAFIVMVVGLTLRLIPLAIIGALMLVALAFKDTSNEQ